MAKGDQGIEASYTYELDIAPGKDGTPGRVIVMRELMCEEFEGLVKNLGADTPAWELAQRGLRISLVSDGGEDLKYTDLVGAKLSRRFRTKELLTLRGMFDSIHMPNSEDASRVKAALTGR